MEVINQVVPLHIVYLEFILMFLLSPLFVLTYYAGISMPVMRYTIKI